jgi:hypothetical protein
VNVSEQIEVLKKEANDQRIYHKAVRIARKLGTRTRKKHGSYWDFKDEIFSIRFDDWGPNLWINFNGESVFYVHIGQIERYRPDISRWIPHLKEIHENQVKPIFRQQLEEKKAKEAAENFKKFGIITH